ncbi:MAG: GTPase Era, partial [Vicinamibacteria bacterium]|nr:GTPase Era [Vicinamibacteria bacterium]
ALTGEKLAIVSDKPQTTRNRILAVVNRPRGQMVLLDTPGIHKAQDRMNRRMVAVAEHSLDQADLALWLVDMANEIGPAEQAIAKLLAQSGVKTILGINKIDTVARPLILPAIERFRHLLEFAEIVPLSALKGEGVELLGEQLLRHLPSGAPLYPDDFLTDMPERFFVAEMIREQILRKTQQEVPYAVAVTIESWQDQETITRIQAVITVERDGQKGILIGKRGEMLKAIGSDARREIETFLATKVFLGLFVKVRENWRENEAMLDELGLGRDAASSTGGQTRRSR